MSEKTIVEVNGIKLEVDLRYARRIDEMRIGDRVKVLKKQYDGFKVHAGIVVGFEPFQKLPTIVCAYVGQDWNKAEMKFLHFNSAAQDVEIVHAADEDFHVDRDAIIARFEREIAAKEREIETIREQQRYFETNFRAYWERVTAEHEGAGLG
jgi:hypothetical protein